MYVFTSARPPPTFFYGPKMARDGPVKKMKFRPSWYLQRSIIRSQKIMNSSTWIAAYGQFCALNGDTLQLKPNAHTTDDLNGLFTKTHLTLKCEHDLTPYALAGSFPIMNGLPYLDMGIFGTLELTMGVSSKFIPVIDFPDSLDKINIIGRDFAEFSLNFDAEQFSLGTLTQIDILNIEGFYGHDFSVVTANINKMVLRFAVDYEEGRIINNDSFTFINQVNVSSLVLCLSDHVIYSIKYHDLVSDFNGLQELSIIGGDTSIFSPYLQGLSIPNLCLLGANIHGQNTNFFINFGHINLVTYDEIDEKTQDALNLEQQIGNIGNLVALAAPGAGM